MRNFVLACVAVLLSSAALADDQNGKDYQVVSMLQSAGESSGYWPCIRKELTRSMRDPAMA